MSIFMTPLLLSLMFGPAQAQENLGTLDISYFRPPSDGYRYYNAPSATTLRHLQMGVSFWVSYENDPLIFVSSGRRVAPEVVIVEGDLGDAVIDHRVMSNLQVSLGFFQHVSLAVDLPLIFWQSGYQLDSLMFDQDPAYLIPSGIGDLRFTAKAVLIDRDKMPIGLAVYLPVGTPTSSGGSLFGEEAFSYTPTGVIEFSDAPVRDRSYKIRASGYLGYHIRPDDMLLNTPIGSQLVYGGGIAYHPVDFIEFLIEYTGKSGADGTTGELLGGLKILGGNAVEINGGGGLGVIPGIGTTDIRGVFGVTVAPDFDPRFRDPDGDGIPEKFDKCPMAMEDYDGFQDTDGCPDVDNDQDRILDENDKCPNQAEDYDGQQDDDGCPDNDNDGDGIPDGQDRCVDQPENFNGYMDSDGCPDKDVNTDSDGDGVPDVKDQCTNTREDIDGYMDDDGCPDLDNDGDGLMDYEDQCPVAREVFNRVNDEDGCPDESDRVRIVSNRIQINEKIFFDFAKATIKPRSYDLIDEIASLILAKPKLRIIQIVGHTDDVGSDAANMQLSQRRAEAVREALIQRKVESHRLGARGMGERKPLVKGTSEAARAKNRRVEFLIEYKQENDDVSFLDCMYIG